MRVFLSWSGERSRAVANALCDWLPRLHPSIDPRILSEDTSGAHGADQIAEVLQSVDAAIICVTPENLRSLWPMYEAGALSKRVGNSSVYTYALALSPSDIGAPLAKFQNARAEREDTFELVRLLNAQSEGRWQEYKLRALFNDRWPALESQLSAIEEPVRSSPNQTLDKKIDEPLSLIRGPTRGLNESHGLIPPPPPTSAEPERSRQPRAFIGSSTEGLTIAEAIQLGLEAVAECTIWNQSAFGLTRTTIEGVVDIAGEFDFAVLVLTADDMLTKRGKSSFAPRDNLLFELGLFTGALGRARTFIVYCRDEELELPSDLRGVTAATFARRSDGNLHAALGPVCTRIKRAMGVA